MDGEIVKSLEFLSSEYDDMIAFRNDAKRQLQLLNERLSSLVKQVDEISEAIDAIEQYSYQYNVKIVGIPEVHSRESATETYTLCVRLFRAMGAAISIQDIDITHRTPSRSATSGPKPII